LQTEARPHIAIVVNSIEPGGGVSNVALAQAKALSEYFSISLLCAHGSLEHKDIEIHEVAEPKLFWMRRFGHAIREYLLCRRFSSALCAIDKVKPLRFVLFHSHTAIAMAKPKLKAKLGSSVPCGMVIHGDIFTRPKGSYDPLLTWFYKVSSKRAYRLADLVIALSPSMQAKAIEYGSRPQSVTVIPNGIEIVNAVPEKHSNKGKDKFELLFVGRLSVEKAPLVLLKAMTMLDDSIRLSIAGSGPLEMQVREFIDTSDLQDQVALLGHLATADINDLYINSDALCVPSINDPLPTVILEAMKLGLPVIASDIDGIPYMVEDGLTGSLVPANDPTALAKAITELSASAALQAQMSKAAKQRVNDKFSLTAVTTQLANSINDAIMDD